MIIVLFFLFFCFQYYNRLFSTKLQALHIRKEGAKSGKSCGEDKHTEDQRAGKGKRHEFKTA